jgi:carbon storage regulator
MLVLTRKRMEKLYIGGDICVTVVRLEGGQVRLGIEAPRDVPVVRAELRERDRAAAAAAFARDAAEAEGSLLPAEAPPSAGWPMRPAPLAERGRGARDQDCATRAASLKR